MNSHFIRNSLMTIALSLLLQPAQAGWGDLLKQIEERAPELLKGSADSSTEIDTDTLVQGLKQALELSTRRAVEGVSQTDGYFANPAIRIPLPAAINRGAALLRQLGMAAQVEAFEVSMNRAAEQAAPLATKFFMAELEQLSIEDARTIYKGADDAATRYFQERTATQLEAAFKPVITATMQQAGVTRYYQALVQQASQYPVIGGLGINLEAYVTRQALAGLFVMLAEEEKRIRADPLARSTDLLKQLFAQ
ncbi:MAG: hypothetical protein ACI9W6_002184 [Motiliproteus sp.]|jgi:hypothetical protein